MMFGVDRKLCVLGLCTLLQQHCGGKVDVVNGSMQTLMPSFLTLFSGLKRAYQCEYQPPNRIVVLRMGAVFWWIMKESCLVFRIILSTNTAKS